MSARKDCFLSIKSGRVGSRSRTTQTHYLVPNSTYILLNEKQVVFILENVDGNLLLREARQDPKKTAQRTKGYLRKNPCLHRINLFNLMYFTIFESETIFSVKPLLSVKPYLNVKPFLVWNRIGMIPYSCETVFECDAGKIDIRP